MSKTYNQIKRKIEEVFKRNNLRLINTEKVYLPSEDYLIFMEATLNKGYNLSWWGIPVVETRGSAIYFIIKNKE